MRHEPIVVQLVQNSIIILRNASNVTFGFALLSAKTIGALSGKVGAGLPAGKSQGVLGH